jgi:ornithine cyclodeaminase
MKILLLNEKEMRNIMSMRDAILAVKEAASNYSAGKTDIPLRTNLNVKEFNGNSLYMYGYVPDSKALGVKLVSVYPDNPKKGVNACPATVVLENAETGEVNALLDGTYLTRLRTGALSGAATELLSREDSKVFALIGTGGQAECQLEAVLTVRDIKEVRVYSRNIDNVKKFVEKVSAGKSQKFIVCKTPDEAIDDADIITAVTVSNDPVFDGKKVKKGCHINGVGSYTPEMSEIDEYIVCNAKTIIVDTIDGTINETGDFLKPLKKGIFNIKMITGELGNLVDGKCSGRKSDEDITFFETTGSAVFDLVTGQKIYELALKKGMGQVIEM